MYELLKRAAYPRSSAYDPVWLMTNMMGPCSVWLTEALTADVALAPDLHVVDLGCGKAMSSIFLAREFGVRVTAVDPWISADENEARIADAGLSGIVDAVHADARAYVPPDGGVDGLVSVDAFHYFAQEPGALDVRTGARPTSLAIGRRASGHSRASSGGSSCSTAHLGCESTG